MRRLDWIMITSVVALCVVGTVLIWSSGGVPYLQRQALSAGLGVAVMASVSFVDHRLLRAYAPVIFGASVLALIATLTPLGRTINGSHSWLAIGPVQLQPSEFAKIGLIMMLAAALGEARDGERYPRGTAVLAALGWAAIPLGLIMLQPDLGTALVFAFITLAMLIVAGVRWIWPVGLATAGAGTAVLAFLLGIVPAHQIARFTAFAQLRPDYTSGQAIMTIGSGGTFGRGLFRGDQTAGAYVPEQHTDFIFTAAGEELGFAGAALVIGLLWLVMWRGLRVGSASGTAYGSLLAGGVVAWFAFQIFINAGMSLGIVPIIGLPLPFVSYGGSSLIAGLLALGLLQSLYRGPAPATIIDARITSHLS